MKAKDLEAQADIPDNPEHEQDPHRPAFPRRETPLSKGARAEIERAVGDFAFQLQALAREKARSLDEVQSVNVRDARTQLLVTRLDELANIGVVILLPIGLFLLGISTNALVGAVAGQPMHWMHILLATLGGLISGASLGVYFTKPMLKRLVSNRKKVDPSRHTPKIAR